MKAILAFIKPIKLEEVKEGLAEQLGLRGLTIIDVRGFGRDKGHSEIYRGGEYTIEYLSSIMVMTVVPDDHVDTVVHTIIENSRTGKDSKTGHINDGKIFVLPVEHAIRIRTGESGEEALW